MDCDDICAPCRYKSTAGCTDEVKDLGEFHSKEAYNRMIDESLVSCLNLKLDLVYTAREYCEIIYQNREIIFDVFTLEPLENTVKRFRLLCRGCRKYLEID